MIGVSTPRACQDAHRKEVFKDFNLLMYEIKELVMGPSHRQDEV